MAREVVQRFEVVYEPDEGGFHVFVPALKGCHSGGPLRDEAREHVKEAIALWLESAYDLSSITVVAQLKNDTG